MKLRPRELEVARLVRDGLSNKEIASRLHISESYVKLLIRDILRVWKLRNRAHLAATIERLEPSKPNVPSVA
jgi:two-component system nitrate/nitrite response regulator NarP